MVIPYVTRIAHTNLYRAHILTIFLVHFRSVPNPKLMYIDLRHDLAFFNLSETFSFLRRRLFDLSFDPANGANPAVYYRGVAHGYTSTRLKYLEGLITVGDAA